jgi:4-amino-4-deoxy-L-arabinose transferase-like glycosyltransferase
LRSEARRGTPVATTGGAGVLSRSNLVLIGILALGLLIRLVFIGADGFKGDVSTFESWALTLADHSPRDFYAKAGFADYPPGYFLVLWIVGHLYRLLVHDDPTYSLLKIAIKLPSILMDLVDAALVFAIVRRYASLPWAFASAAVMALNPAAIYISSYWGQVDSVSAAFILGALLLVVLSEEARGRRASFLFAGAWLLLGYSILIKPPATVLVPLFLAFPFVPRESERRVERLFGTYMGVGAALLVAYLAAVAFHPGLNVADQFTWLLHRYSYASNVYAYNTVNAFNLYALSHAFWQPDNVIEPGFALFGQTIGLPQYIWGIVLVGFTEILVIARYVQSDKRTAFLEAALLLSLGFFILATRMHERYVFNAFVLAIVLMFVGKRYVAAAAILTVTLFANLFYSLAYLHAMDVPVAGVDATNLMPFLSRACAFANVATFFYLGYVYLGGADFVFGAWSTARERVPVAARRWFSTVEGTVAMLPLDYAIAGGLVVVSFVLCYVNMWLPAEKVFDEVYYARAAEEYLRHVDVFEFTHPPLTKLVITLSTMIFGDTPYGWRFGNVVVGALTVGVLYAFAKRLLGSTWLATVAALFLVFDGFHYVQSRIATPEITVAFFSLTTLYAFYRVWIGRQVRVAPQPIPSLLRTQAIVLAVASVVALAIASVFLRGQSPTAIVVALLYVETGVYLAVRLAVPRFMQIAPETSFADGSRVVDGELRTFDGGRLPLGRGSAIAGEDTRLERDALVFAEGPLKISYARTGTETYTEPDGTATFDEEGTMTTPGATIRARDASLWFWLMALSCGALAASKWNGLFVFFVIWVVAAFVMSQSLWAPTLRAMGLRATTRPAVWGNPFGISIDVLVAAMMFVGATIYVLTYIPYFTLGKSLTDLVDLQQGMYHYHATLVATHPYSSVWWQWPILQIPISYYWHDGRVGGVGCCVAEIMAIPNPVTWWTGLISVPFVAWLAWRERSKGYLLLIVAYFLQWLPWIASPRLAFEYHFYPNLAIIILCDVVLLHRVQRALRRLQSAGPMVNYVIPAYLCVVLAAFVFFYPVLSAYPITGDQWNARMLTWLEGTNWILPHPGQK